MADNDEAKAQLRKTLELSLNSLPDALFRLGQLLDAEGKHEEARDWWTTLIE